MWRIKLVGDVSQVVCSLSEYGQKYQRAEFEKLHGKPFLADRRIAEDLIRAGVAVRVEKHRSRYPAIPAWKRENQHWWRICSRWFRSLGVRDPVLMPFAGRGILTCARCHAAKKHLLWRRVNTRLGSFRLAVCARCANAVDEFHLGFK